MRSGGIALLATLDLGIAAIAMLGGGVAAGTFFGMTAHLSAGDGTEG